MYFHFNWKSKLYSEPQIHVNCKYCKLIDFHFNCLTLQTYLNPNTTWCMTLLMDVVIIRLTSVIGWFSLEANILVSVLASSWMTSSIDFLPTPKSLILCRANRRTFFQCSPFAQTRPIDILKRQKYESDTDKSLKKYKVDRHSVVVNIFLWGGWTLMCWEKIGGGCQKIDQTWY